jgi:nucleoside-diphosphate-sugar epimerase
MDAADFVRWYQGKTVVVTGGYGYLGTGLCDRLRAAGARLRRVSRGRPVRADDPECCIGDVADSIFSRKLVDGADAIFHFGAQTSVLQSHADSLGSLRSNTQATLTLLESGRQSGRNPAFVYAGTATSIGLPTEMPVGVQTPDRPVSVYDATKLAGENLVDVFRSNGWVNGISLRIANVYGPGPSKTASERGVTNKMIACALEGHDLTYYGDGTLLRDYVYIDDLLDAFFRAGVTADRADQRYYIVAGGRGYSLREAFELIADTVADMGYPRVKVHSVPWPATVHLIDKRDFIADVAPLGRLCGWQPQISLAHGLRRTAEWLKEGAI